MRNFEDELTYQEESDESVAQPKLEESQFYPNIKVNYIDENKKSVNKSRLFNFDLNNRLASASRTMPVNSPLRKIETYVP